MTYREKISIYISGKKSYFKSNMPRRMTPLVTGEFYHIFNRGIASQPIFPYRWDYRRALEILKFYLFSHPPIRYSQFLLLPQKQRQVILENLQKQPKLVDLLCFCLMPNHFHFLLRQKEDEGISSFLRNFQISYTRYFNRKRKRLGPLLQGQFKAVRIETDEQLLHLSRYIHLNPYSSFVVKSLREMESYPWSSYLEYQGKVKEGICEKSFLFSLISQENYQKFVLDQADYQRKLEQIKHLRLEE